MFTSCHPVAEERIPIPAEAGERSPFTPFLEIVGILNDLFEERPRLLGLPGGNCVTVLYRDVVYLPRDIIDSVGPLAAQVSQELPIRFIGTTDARETAEMTVRPQDGKTVLLQLRSPSGRPVDRLYGLGVHLNVPGEHSLAYLADVIAAMPPDGPLIGAVPKKHERFLRSGGLLVPVEGAFFAYFSWEPETDRRQLLYTLAAAHKLLLWEAFLEDGVQPREFDWLWEIYYTEKASYLLEWELALRMVLEKLCFHVERGERSYRLADGSGRERRFDFIQGGPAEKVFLKLLFPVDDK
nr:hypothetical protein [uncultured Dysosmobacter sp.]